MKNILKISGLYQLLMGVGMIGIWILTLLAGEVPELQAEPFGIAAHLLAEVTTGTMLLVSGCFILLKGRKSMLFNLSSGALIYTLIASPGYFAEMDRWGVVALFLLLLITTVALLIVQDKKE